jgi:glycogen debranching enzyme
MERQWQNNRMDPNSRIFDAVPLARTLLVLPPVALRSVTSKDGTSVYASSDTLFWGAVFGRDSLEVAEDLIRIKPGLVHNILLTLGRLQGVTHNAANEEDPGKIIHESRTVRINGEYIKGEPLRIFRTLAPKWGGNDEALAYYGSVDSTPHFLRTLGMYCLAYGDNILSETVVRRDGETGTMREAAEAAAGWLNDRLAASRSGLIEFERMNPLGIANQAWKDSDEFYVHENGEFANHAAPIASIEVQALAYDGLLAAARLLPDRARDYAAKAHRLRNRTLQLLWQPGRQYFALGIDFDRSGAQRIIKTRTANPGALLDSGLLEGLPAPIQKKYVAGIVQTIMSADFLTDAGIRSRARDQAHLVDHADYHGSLVTWPKETYDIAKGLRRWGFQKLARQLEDRLLNLVLRFHEYPEFVYVDAHGRVFGGRPVRRKHGEINLASNITPIAGRNIPERIQAWTVSAIMAIVTERLSNKLRPPFSRQQRVPLPWITHLEGEILATIPQRRRSLSPLKLALGYPNYKYAVAPRDKTAL